MTGVFLYLFGLLALLVVVLVVLSKILAKERDAARARRDRSSHGD